MDYSQFLAMKQEIALLVVFLLVFLNDTFLPRNAQAAIGKVTALLFGIFTLWGFCPVVIGEGVQTAFEGMYETSPVIVAIKNILNVGVFIVLIQSLKWTAGESQVIRRGEFYELLLVTLFGMYLMISGRHFLWLQWLHLKSVATKAMKQQPSIYLLQCSLRPYCLWDFLSCMVFAVRSISEKSLM